MPIMTVQHPADSLTPDMKAALAGRLTDVLIRMEGGANTPGGRAFAWVLFQELAAGDWWVGGRTDDQFVAKPGNFLVHVAIPEGYMNAAHKAEVHAWVTDAIMSVTGEGRGTFDAPAGGSVLVVIDEVPEGNWGAAGLPISLSRIAASVGMPQDGARFDWVRSYFGAKARMRKAFDYPADTGGLL